MEKRLPIAIVVHLADQALGTAELTYTKNISAHGACVISSRPWKHGESVEVTNLEDELALRGKVVHCQKRSEDLYAIGLNFPNHILWSEFCSANGCPPKQLVSLPPVV